MTNHSNAATRKDDPLDGPFFEEGSAFLRLAAARRPAAALLPVIGQGASSPWPRRGRCR